MDVNDPSDFRNIPIYEPKIRDPRGVIHPLDPAYNPPVYEPDPWFAYKFSFTTTINPGHRNYEELRELLHQFNESQKRIE